jgi:hypothetical protein
MDSAMAAEGSGDSDPASYAAMGSASASNPNVQPSGGPIAREFAAAQQQVAASSGSSMADTLQATFGSANSAAAPDSVRNAYGRMRALGL